MHMNFECHITVPLEQKEAARRAVVELGGGWTDSEIERDPVLGKASYFYLTTHDNDYVRMYGRMHALCGVLTQEGVRVIREKIELIMHDVRHGNTNHQVVPPLREA